ncbi:MAG: phosphate acetyltransferase [Thermomicrobiales bacterium]|nr:phosphate acetyltransferase [Thermomicrobiales bacterium]
MTNGIYITSAEGHSGKSMVALGLLSVLSAAGVDVGIYRPVTKSKSEPDALLERLISEIGITDPASDCVGVSYEDVHHDPAGSLGDIIATYNTLATRHEAMVILGSDYTDVTSPTELAYNARIAANLGSSVLLVLGGRDADQYTPSNSQFLSGSPRTVADIRSTAELAIAEMVDEHAQLAGIVINRAETTSSEYEAALREHELIGNDVPIWTIPEDRRLVSPTVRDLMVSLGGRQIYGAEADLDNYVFAYIVAGMNMEHVLERLLDGGVIVVPADRSEVLVSVLVAQASHTFPNLSGIILNGGFEISPIIQKLIDGLDFDLPIVDVPLGTFPTTLGITRTRAGFATAPAKKIALGREMFADHVAKDDVLALVDRAKTDIVTPLMFEHMLMQRAAGNPKRIVLPEGEDDRILAAAAEVLERGAAKLTILGDREDILARAHARDLNLDGADIISPHDPELVETFADEYAKLRAHKGMTVEKALEIVPDVSYFGTMMVKMGMADGMVSGAAHTTAHTIKPAFEVIKTTPDVSIVSSVFLMALADRVLVYGDCAVNPNPTAEQLADIAITSAKSARQFDIEPRIAMLSYSTGASGHGDDVDRVRTATELVRQRAPELLVEGPIQYDAAADASVAKSKLPGSSVAGQATVFIFPDLNTGNNTYKAVQRSAGAVAIGPMLQGLRKPINDLSRGALVKDIVNTVAMTVIQAQGEEQ